MLSYKGKPEVMLLCDGHTVTYIVSLLFQLEVYILVIKHIAQFIDIVS